MPKKVTEMSALKVRNLREPGMWAVGGVAGLYLQIIETGARSWILRAVIAGKRREIGLGGFPDTTLEQAKSKARETRRCIDGGEDPVELKKQAKSKLAAARAAEKTFQDCAKLYLDKHSNGWKHPKTHGQWKASFENYVYPIIGKLLVRDINQTHILQCLEPIWQTKTETATRVRNRIESVLAFAAVSGYRSSENPAQWKNHLDKLLPAPGRVRTAQHFAALPYEKLGQFMTELRAREGISSKALEFLILTATRSNEVRGARWSEIEDGLWAIPATRMKSGKEHRIPLSTQAQKLLKTIPKIDGNDYIFPSTKGKELSDMALLKVVRDMKAKCVPHGFRSTFRDWAGDCTNHPREIAEQALAHTLKDKTEAAYRRSDALQKRALLMQEWANFCDKKQQAGKVVQLRENTA